LIDLHYDSSADHSLLLLLVKLH